MRNCCSSPSDVHTLSNNVVDSRARLIRHEADDREYDEAGENACGAIQDRNNQRVPMNIYNMAQVLLAVNQYSDVSDNE